MNIAAGRYRAIPAGVSPACADLIRAMLVVDPCARPSLDAILAHPWLAEAAAQAADSAAGEQPAQEVDAAAGAAEPSGADGCAAVAAMDVDVDAPVTAHSVGCRAAQGGSAQPAAAAAAAVLAQLASPAELGPLQPPVEAAAGGMLCTIGGPAAALSSRGPSASESAGLPASISAFPVEERRTFSFHMGAPQEGGKAAPATPRVVSLAAAAGGAAAAGAVAGAKAPAQQGPPSRGGGALDEAPRPRFGLAAFLCGFLWG